ncbi:hypothetical protein [Pedosphaera parvula]|uniref:Beta-ketoacyl synthase N-terminal domain-containing protein n=1 Tax=Pedosphaera parvula (strain Ellin514) TaxID=320771 RepID=B9XE03_PEDPL|nr:hypothetical protein [Pedosphaera parvula]EEF61894.1 hypothetical protein Cflav_PD4557 [Pedosphaera parvula Ellin514]
MCYLVASTIVESIAPVQESDPELWRQIRRYNLPVQLALTAAHETAKTAENPASAALFSLAPCQSGSLDLHRWTRLAATAGQDGHIGHLRVNPTHTLHAVDNLALSAFAIMHRNHEHCLGLGGAAGQAWCGLEALHERLRDGNETEAFLIAGDQADDQGTTGSGIALLFSKSPKPYVPLGRLVKLVAVQRVRLDTPAALEPHAAAGLISLVAVIGNHKTGRLSYTVPSNHGNGMDLITVEMEFSRS